MFNYQEWQSISAGLALQADSCQRLSVRKGVPAGVAAEYVKASQFASELRKKVEAEAIKVKPVEKKA